MQERIGEDKAQGINKAVRYSEDFGLYPKTIRVWCQVEK